MGTLSTRRSSTWVAFAVTAAFFALATGAAGQSTTGYTVKIYVQGTYCVGETLTYEGSLSPDRPDTQFRWFLDQPDGTQVQSNEMRFQNVARLVGTYTATLIVNDGNGNKLGSETRAVEIARCEVTPASPGPTATEPHRDCYQEGYGFYDCNYPPPTTQGCYYVRDDQTGEAYQKCDPTTTQEPSNYNADTCRQLSDAQNQFYSQWKYDYNAYYERMGTEPGSDFQFEEDMRIQREQFDQDWQRKWNDYDCDRPYSNPDCAVRWENAQQAMNSLKEQWSQTWNEFYRAMENARASWSTYSEDERATLEEKWRARAAELSAQYDREMSSIADRYLLWECGYYAENAPIEPRYQISAAPSQESALRVIRSDCDQRMAAAKELYLGEFETLRSKLEAATPGTADYDALRQRLADLEQKVATEVEAILAACRNDYKDEYNAPENFRDGLGSLQCYYDDATSKIQCRGTYVTFVGDPQSQFLSRFTCGGQPVFDDLYANRVFEDFQFIEDQQSASLLIRSENLKLLFHDGPRGVINFGAVGDAELYLVPSPHLSVTATSNGLEMTASSGWTSVLIGDGNGDAITYDAIKGVIIVRGEATWLAQTCRPDGVDPDGDVGAEYYDAIKTRRLGAQVTISFDGDESQSDEEDYTDMDIDVEHQGGKKFLATIDSTDGACKTVVLKFNAGIFETIKLEVLMSDDEGNSIRVREADNLEDILDPCNDGEEGFEYWIVQDRHGTQVLVSFAHFSEKRVSVEAASVGNVIVPGFDGITATLAVAFAALVFVGIRRRLTR